MWLSLCVLLVVFLGGFPILAVKHLPIEMMDRRMSLAEVAIFCAVALPFIVMLTYGAVITWPLAWRHFATQSEVMRIATSGPTTRFDRWLTRKFGPQK